ncbi:phosphomannomutase [Shewanella psychrophila]|uniref:Phosphomannomutase n=1 Tax=Shewanella psychrophila TaxID=225848 RepID=A0A1S6HSA0_9GAMM|nr:phosphomannomutase [Shewanella psychrophila]AQS38399.1 phosphomannomutase [Shewanella psychrophila]
MLLSSDVIKTSGIAFGTSGARGLVSLFTNEVCAAFTHAFVAIQLKNSNIKHVAIAMDNRPSSFRMAMACAKALEQLGIEAIYYGVLPTPALAYTAMQDNMPCIMVTGSHIPFDRNGLKFYLPDGEISKSDEQEILCTKAEFSPIDDIPNLAVNPRAARLYIQRYTSLFDTSFLAGKRIGIYEHSSSGRDLYFEIFSALGAEIISLERSDKFVPIDTEAVSDEDIAKAQLWSEQYSLDAIFSTDGDGDRPLVADENGTWLRGDILGLICANALHIKALAIPVNSNTAIESSAYFSHVKRTKIGSPYVIAEFSALAKNYETIAGFEANGGFLLGSDVRFEQHTIKALPTRDAVLPTLMLFSGSKHDTISALVDSLPKRVTYSDRIKNFATDRSQIILSLGQEKPNQLLKALGFKEVLIRSLDYTDGLRMTLKDSRIIHLRPSGNAPELRCYAEADSVYMAKSIVNKCLDKITVDGFIDLLSQ